MFAQNANKELVLHKSHAKLLEILNTKKGITQKELIAKSSLSARTVKYALKTLSENGLLVQERSMRDLRYIKYYKVV
ncbi:winged helix-turn-helix transcriptional regulator [Candidatus Woesearchaeota archaeon]|nr:winged helix-turn-helix transcriptional regulator [Candidatus Woesearchaeota archaeon]